MLGILKRLFCLHYWIKSEVIDDLYLASEISMVDPWRCDKCDKRVFKEWGWIPLNFYEER